MNWNRNVAVCLTWLFASLVAGMRMPGTTHVFKWPAVAPLHRTSYFPNAKRASGQLVIRGTDNRPLYLLRCRPFGEGEDPDHFNYSGDFACRLTSLYEKGLYTTLLTFDPFNTRDQFSRAVFVSEELVGNCANYPEYGATRTFRLRGMKLTLALSNIKFRRELKAPGGPLGPVIDSFRFNVRVESDADALSAIDEDVPFIAPPFKNPGVEGDHTRDCDHVIRSSVAGRLSEEQVAMEGRVPCLARPMNETSLSWRVALECGTGLESRRSGIEDSYRCRVLPCRRSGMPRTTEAMMHESRRLAATEPCAAARVFLFRERWAAGRGSPAPGPAPSGWRAEAEWRSPRCSAPPHGPRCCRRRL